MSTKRFHANDDHLKPHQRRQAIILLLATGLVRMHSDDIPHEDSAESRQKPLGCAAKTRPCVTVG